MMHIKINGDTSNLFKGDMDAFTRDLDTAMNTAATIVQSGAKTHAGGYCINGERPRDGHAHARKH